MKGRGLLAIIGALLLAACQSPRPVAISPNAVVVVKDYRIPEDYPKVSHFARHTVLEFREDPDAQWQRVQIGTWGKQLNYGYISESDFRRTHSAGRRIRVIGQVEHVPGVSFPEQILKVARSYDASLYRPWPGPNSNTFVMAVLREVKGLPVVLDHNAVGKEHGWFLGVPPGGPGLEIQTPFLGAAVGVREGVEVSLLGLSGGIGIAPFAIRIPFFQEFPRRRTTL